MCHQGSVVSRECKNSVSF